MPKCGWCKKDAKELFPYGDEGVLYELCKQCSVAVENYVCVTCGDNLDGVVLNGECSGCQQIRVAKAEKKRSEILNGLGIDILAELTHSVVFTEADYEKWVTFSQGNFTPEKKKMNRRNWLRHKMMMESGWTMDEFIANMLDIEYLFDNYSNKIFNQSYVFVLKTDKSKKLRGLDIVASHGNVLVINTSEIALE